MRMSTLYSSWRAVRSRKDIFGGDSDGVPPLPIPNREVKPVIADGTAMQCGRVGSRLLLYEGRSKEKYPERPSFFVFNSLRAGRGHRPVHNLIIICYHFTLLYYIYNWLSRYHNVWNRQAVYSLQITPIYNICNIILNPFYPVCHKKHSSYINAADVWIFDYLVVSLHIVSET